MRLCDCVFECVGECDCESGSAKRICACDVAVSSLLLLLHLNRQRGVAASRLKVCFVTARGRHPPLSSLIIAHQKVALWCLYVPQQPPTAWEHRRTQEALSIIIRGGDGEGERWVRRHLEGGREGGRGDRAGETMLLSYYPLEITDQCHNYYLEVKLI